MAKKRRHGSKKMTLPVAFAAPLVATGIEAGKFLAAGNTDELVYMFTGVNRAGQFGARKVVETYTPIAIGYGVHKIAGALGANRALARMRIPFIRI